jgi:hypothetical protein
LIAKKDSPSRSIFERLSFYTHEQQTKGYQRKGALPDKRLLM